MEILRKNKNEMLRDQKQFNRNNAFDELFGRSDTAEERFYTLKDLSIKYSKSGKQINVTAKG